MIDIFENGPYLNLQELIGGSLQECSQFLMHFFICILVILAARKADNRHISAIAILLLPISQIIYVWSVSIKSEFLYSLLFALLLTAQIRVLGLLPLQVLDYAFLFSVMLFPNRLFNTTSALLGNLWFFWIIFCAVYVTTKSGLGRLKGYHFICYFLFVLLSFTSYMYYLVSIFLYPLLSGLIGNSAVALIFILSLSMTICLVLTFYIKYRFSSQLIKLNQLGKKHPDIEKYFISFSLLILMLFTLIFLPFSFFNQQTPLILLLMPCLCLASLCIQMPFIILLFRVAVYKNNATFYEWEKEGIASYYQNLTESLSEMQEMRHDVKNIFFTMGSFVERSNDPEMKNFFWEKIYPYSMETIKQNELLSKLYQIPVESLRAFFNLKISQALNKKIELDLNVSLIPETFQAGMDIIDLTRILGIILDNAIEETTLLENGCISIKISGNDTGCSYVIKNTISEQTKLHGIHMGTTTKGSGHGKGLHIVHELLAQYHTVSLNSSMQELTYIQSLNIVF